MKTYLNAAEKKDGSKLCPSRDFGNHIYEGGKCSFCSETSEEADRKPRTLFPIVDDYLRDSAKRDEANRTRHYDTAARAKSRMDRALKAMTKEARNYLSELLERKG